MPKLALCWLLDLGARLRGRTKITCFLEGFREGSGNGSAEGFWGRVLGKKVPRWVLRSGLAVRGFTVKKVLKGFSEGVLRRGFPESA